MFLLGGLPSFDPIAIDPVIRPDIPNTRATTASTKTVDSCLIP